MPWLQARIAVSATRAEGFADLLLAAGAVSISMEDAATQLLVEPAPGDTPLWERTAVIGLFPLDISIADLRAQIEAQLERDEDWTITLLADQDWGRVWLAQYKPLLFGAKLWVCPSWCPPPAADMATIVLDPGLAFGTGTHASTALCLEWLTQQDLQGKRVIDYGCGSGILALAALRLGAADAIGVDIDPTALAVSIENAQRNALATRYSAMLPQQLESARRAPLVLANILAGPLVDLAAMLSDRVEPGGQLIMAGLLATQIDEVRDAYAHAFEFLSATRDEWALLVGTKRHSTARASHTR